MAELPETVRSHGHTPRGVERTIRSEAPDQKAVGIEDIDETVARPRLVIMLTGLLERIGDEEVASKVGNPEGCETRRAWGRGREQRIDKGTGEVNLVEMCVEDVDDARVEIGGEQEVALGVSARSQAFVDGTGGRVIH